MPSDRPCITVKMRLPWILLPLLAQGTLGVLFRTQPEPEQVVHQGNEVTLECVTNEDVTCAWKAEDTQFGASGFLLNPLPPNLDISIREPDSSRDCTIIISNINDRYNGTYTCSPYTSAGGQLDSDAAVVIIAKKPQSLRYLGQASTGYPLQISADTPTSIQCMAELAMPKAEIVWYLDNTQLYDTIEVNDTQLDKLWNTVSTLTYQFSKEDNGKSLRCRANHAGYDAEDQDNRETAVDLDIRFAAYRPGGNNIGRLYGFTAGQPGEVTVNFTSNPQPIAGQWMVGDVKVPVAGQTLDGRFRSGPITATNAKLGMYALTLTIDPVQLEDQNKKFLLVLDNADEQRSTTELEFAIGTGARPPPQGLQGATIGGIVAAVLVLLIIIGVVAFGRSRGKWCFAGKGRDKPDKPAPPRPLKARRPSASAGSVGRVAGGGGGSGSGGGGGSRRGSLSAAAGRRGSRGAGGGKFALPLSLAAFKQSMSARPNRQRYAPDDGSVEVGVEEVTYVNRMPPAGEEGDTGSAPQPLVKDGSPTPVPEATLVEEKEPEPVPVEIPELDAPPRSISSPAGRLAETDLSAMPRTPPTPISPIIFPTSQPPAAVSSPLSSELDSPTSSLDPPQYPKPGQQRLSQKGPVGAPSLGPGQQRPTQMGPAGAPQMGSGQQRPAQVGLPVQMRPSQGEVSGPHQMGPAGPQLGQPPQKSLRGSERDDRRGSGRSDQSDRWGSGPMDPGTYSNTGPALPAKNAASRWSQSAAGRQRGAIALPPDSPGFAERPSVDLPPAGSREELGIPYPPPDQVVRRQGPPLPPKNRPQSQVPAGAVRVLPGAMQSELSARFPSSPSLLDPIGDGSAV